tara:strand:- start:2048 stop:2272 length:225 start_codon:yes stop_codon:yes gene_type:complete
MEIKQIKEGNIKFNFSWKERFKIFFKGGMLLSFDTSKNFINSFVHTIVTFNTNLPEKYQNKLSDENTKIDLNKK